MPVMLIEEHRRYGIDATDAVWASDDMHALYHACGVSMLCDADFVLETEAYILLVEYKNAAIREAFAHTADSGGYDPFEDKKIDKIVRKYYDSLHYLRLAGKSKPVRFIFVLEYRNGTSTSRKMLRNRLQRRLPFKLQRRFEACRKLIDAVDVVNIEEWNAHELYGRFPILQVDGAGVPLR